MTVGLGYSLFFDVAILVLLLATMAYAFVLNRKLSLLRRTKDEMADMIASFAQATSKAEQGLEAMKALASGSNVELDTRLAKAGELRKDLAFLVDKAEASCNRLESAIDRDRQRSASAARAAGGAAQPKVADFPHQRPVFGSKQAMSKEPAASRAQPQRRLSPNEAGLLKALQGLR